MTVDRDTTQKIKGLPANMQMDEKEYARYLYDKAKARLAPENHPTQKDIDDFIAASIKLKYTLSAYELAAELIAERAFNLKYSFKEIIKR